MDNVHVDNQDYWFNDSVLLDAESDYTPLWIVNELGDIEYVES